MYVNVRPASIVKFAIVLTVIIIIVFTLAGRATERSKWERDREVITVTVTRGDTLWGFASEYCPACISDYNDYISLIKDLNGMQSSNLRVGQHIKLYS